MTPAELRGELDLYLDQLEIPEGPLQSLERANRSVVENFLAVMVLSDRRDAIPSLQGPPSKVLAASGLAREGTQLQKLHLELTNELSPEARATLLATLDG
jgi:hypothetical protein